jgi:hypothetical protein
MIRSIGLAACRRKWSSRSLGLRLVSGAAKAEAGAEDTSGGVGSEARGAAAIARLEGSERLAIRPLSADRAAEASCYAKGAAERLRGQAVRPWHFLYFFPEPQGQGALRGIF